MLKINIFLQIILIYYVVFGSKVARNTECELPLESGYCLAYMERYGFSVEEGRCVKFVYGGCRGNDNNFYTMKECQEHCEIGFVARSYYADQYDA